MSDAVVDEQVEHVILVARGISTAVSPETGITELQAELLGAIGEGLTGVPIDYRDLEPLSIDEFADHLSDRVLPYRQRIVHHMVLAELVLRPIPTAVAFRVAKYAEALGVEDPFVRIARRYAQGAYGLAWMDLQRSGFVEHVRDASDDRPGGELGRSDAPAGAFDPAEVDEELEAMWREFSGLAAGTLGRTVFDMYDGRGFLLPGSVGGASGYLAQHDFVHVLADYGTNLKGELEVFALISQADPDPKGFAWLATLVGLFHTGYIASTGFFDRNVSERHVQAAGMPERLGDAMRRGRLISESYRTDLFEVDYYSLADRPVEEAREMIGVPAKSSRALDGGSVGLFDLEGMSELQQQSFATRPGGTS